MKYQRGLALSSLIFWGFILVLGGVMGMKVVPSVLEYYKIQQDIRKVAVQATPEATVADVRKAFDKFAEVDHLDFKSSQLDIYKDRGQLIIAFDYEKRIPLFANVSLVINYKGSSAE